MRLFAISLVIAALGCGPSKQGKGSAAASGANAVSTCSRIADCARECSAKGADGCLRLSLLLDRFGNRTPEHARVLAANLPVLEQGCQAKLPRVCGYYAELMCSGASSDDCEARALAIHKSACDTGDPVGCREHARGLAHDDPGRAAARKHAAELLEKDCAAGEAYSCVLVSDLLDDDLTTARARSMRSFRQLIDHYEPLCPKDGLACLHAAMARMFRGEKAEAEALRKQGCERVPESVMCLPDDPD